MSFFTFSYSTTLTQSEQGQLSSGYEASLRGAITGSETLANYVGWLYLTQSGSTVEDAIALRDSVLAGNFTLDGLFGAAQSKTGAVAGAAITNPDPLLVVGEKVVDISAMMDDLATHTWKTTTKSSTIYHTREYFTDTQEPAGYDDDWFVTTPDNGAEPAWQTATQTFTFTDDGTLNYDLLGDQWQNVTLTISGDGDFNKATKGGGNEEIILTGDVGAPAPGPFSNPVSGGGNPEGEDNWVTFGPNTVSPTVAQYSDGTIDLAVDFSQPVNGGVVTIVLSYEYA